MTAHSITATKATRIAVVPLALLLFTGCQSTGLDATATGTNAPVAAFASNQAGSEEDFILNVGRRTHFAGGSAALDQTAKTTLDSQAEWLKRHKNWFVKLQGFSDDPGSPNQNKALSKKRAEAVMNYLVSRGVQRDRLWARGYGRERIIRNCPEIECKSQNRRVVTNLRDERET